jgi:hypothetical protein
MLLAKRFNGARAAFQDDSTAEPCPFEDRAQRSAGPFLGSCVLGFRSQDQSTLEVFQKTRPSA